MFYIEKTELLYSIYGESVDKTVFRIFVIILFEYKCGKLSKLLLICFTRINLGDFYKLCNFDLIIIK